jgi:hypothetical protein
VKHYLSQLLLLLCALVVNHQSSADALMINKAMQASSIAEFYIDEQGVTVKLEIGANSLEDFKSLFPDQIYQEMGFGELKLADRLNHFFSEELVLMDKTGQKLTGRLLAMAPSTKVLRNPINGTPLPIQEDAPNVVRAALRYDFDATHRPDELTFVCLIARDIGFVTYHNNVAVNDFRYLASGLVLELDWQDAWYSRFSSRSMKRQYSAPMSGFIYVEPFEVRKEIIVRPKDLQRWVDLGLEGANEITVDVQGQIKEKVAEFLADHQPVTIDGSPEPGILESVNFLERTLTSSRVIDPPEPLNIDSAIIGTIFIYPRDGVLPQKVVMDWDLWDERISRVPVSAVDQAGPLPSFLESDWRQLVWDNFLKHPDIPQLNIIEPPAERWQALLYDSRVPLTVLVVLTLAALGYRTRQRQSVRLAASACGLLIGLNILSYTLGESNQPDEARAEAIIGDLLHNIYRAFDFRAESDIYDVLDRSVHGDLLTDIYLETKRSLVLVSQGGSRAKVKEVTLESVKLQPATGDDRFSAETSWVVNGSVGHWGHIHERNNRYHAILTIKVVGPQWKLEEMTVLQEERL